MGGPTIVSDVVSLLVLAFGVGALVLIARNALRIYADGRRGDGVSRCAECGYDLRASTDVCPECGTKTRHAHFESLRRLREEWPAAPVEPRVPGPGEFLVDVFTTRDHPLAWLLRDHLEARGVATELVDGNTLRAGTKALYLPHSLQVWSGDAEAARAIIDHLCPPEIVAESERLASS